ncbi:hypothetical protein [Aureimonas sp. AU4]|uniref:hypothetical protein n=1 Tax=Aureimonas sp. AU4 TaxID=1638163 RepID=UPI0012E3B58C|nr:hypothetical protein [Aureimonas sp. AU4]
MTRHVQSLAPTHDVSFYWITLISERYVLPESEAANFDQRSLQAWVQQVLHGIDFIGSLELAYYTNLKRGSGRGSVSWHFHGTGWSKTSDLVGKRIDEINASTRTIFPGVVPALAAEIPRRKLTAKLLYALKAPRSAYRVYAFKEDSFDSETGELEKRPTGFFKQKKGALRPGELARVCTFLEGRYLDQLAIAGGEGKSILRKVREESLRPFKREEERLISGGRMGSERYFTGKTRCR